MEKQLTFTIEVHGPEEKEEGERGEDTGYWVSVPALPGCFTQGATYDEAVANAHEAIQCYLEALLKRGEPIPQEQEHPSFIGVQVALPQMA